MAEDNSFTLTAPVRMIWPQLLTPKAFVPKTGKPGEPKYSATFLIPADHPDLTNLKATIARVWREAFSEEIEQKRLPIKSGTAEADKAKEKGKNHEFLRGNVQLYASSPRQPTLTVWNNDGTKLGLTTPDLLKMHGGQFYGGVFAVPSLGISAYKTGANYGVCAYLNLVLSFNNGSTIGGGRDPNDVFAHFKGKVSQEDPLGAI